MSRNRVDILSNTDLVSSSVRGLISTCDYRWIVNETDAVLSAGLREEVVLMICLNARYVVDTRSIGGWVVQKSLISRINTKE